MKVRCLLMAALTAGMTAAVTAVAPAIALAAAQSEEAEGPEGAAGEERAALEEERPRGEGGARGAGSPLAAVRPESQDSVRLQAADAARPEVEDPARLFVVANDAYEAADYGRAAELYRRILATGIDSGHLWYNLGNAHLRAGEVGRAIAAYRRAELRLPRDEDVRANLEFARRTTRDALEPPSPSPVISTLFFWHHGMSLRELAGTALFLNLFFWLLLALRLLGRGQEALKWAAVAVLVPLLAVGASLALRLADPRRTAVVLPREIAAHSGPGADAVVRFKLHAGTEVAIRDRRDGWLRISLPDGQQGWIRTDWAEIVEG